MSTATRTTGWEPDLADADFHAVVDKIDPRAAGGRGAVYLWSVWPTPDLRSRGWELDGHPRRWCAHPRLRGPARPGRGPARSRRPRCSTTHGCACGPSSPSFRRTLRHRTR